MLTGCYRGYFQEAISHAPSPLTLNFCGPLLVLLESHRGRVEASLFFFCASMNYVSNLTNTQIVLHSQIRGLNLIRTKSSVLMDKVNGFWAWIRRNVLVDEVHFPPISHRFTAVYSRDKEYL